MLALAGGVEIILESGGDMSAKKFSFRLNIVVFGFLWTILSEIVFAASAPDPSIDGAKKEGKLVIYRTSTVEPGEKSIGQKMKESFPWLDIDEVLMASGSKLLERMLLEIQAGKAPDIAHMGSGQMGQLK